MGTVICTHCGQRLAGNLARHTRRLHPDVVVSKRGPIARPAIERVLERTERRGDCLVFTGSITTEGYGQVQVGESDKGTRGPALAHRVVYEAHHGPIPDGYDVHHVCHVRACVEVAHLDAIEGTEHGRMHGLERSRRAL